MSLRKSDSAVPTAAAHYQDAPAQPRAVWLATIGLGVVLLAAPMIVAKFLPAPSEALNPEPVVISKRSVNIDTGLKCHADPAALTEFAWKCGDQSRLQAEVDEHSEDPDLALRRMARALNSRARGVPEDTPIHREDSARLLIDPEHAGVTMSTQTAEDQAFAVISGSGAQAAETAKSTWEAMSGKPLSEELSQQVDKAFVGAKKELN